MSEQDPVTLTFRCPRELDGLLPPPVPAASGLPGWFKAMQLGDELAGILQRDKLATAGQQNRIVKLSFPPCRRHQGRL
jgi:hypothetical protein